MLKIKVLLLCVCVQALGEITGCQSPAVRSLLEEVLSRKVSPLASASDPNPDPDPTSIILNRCEKFNKMPHNHK